jgi:hypothetical protein
MVCSREFGGCRRDWRKSCTDSCDVSTCSVPVIYASVIERVNLSLMVSVFEARPNPVCKSFVTSYIPRKINEPSAALRPSIN